jgi:small-conductance mechanosensitive channel
MWEFLDKAAPYGIQASEILLKIIVALLMLFIGFIVGKLIGRFLRRVFHEAEIDSILKKAGIKLNLEGKMSFIFEYGVYAAALVIALYYLGIAVTALRILLLLITLLIAASMLVSLKDILPNLFSGLIVRKKKPISAGDTITIQGISGKVESMGMAEIKIVTKKGDIIYIPNSNFLKNSVKIKKSKNRKAKK